VVCSCWVPSGPVFLEQGPAAPCPGHGSFFFPPLGPCLVRLAMVCLFLVSSVASWCWGLNDVGDLLPCSPPAYYHYCYNICCCAASAASAAADTIRTVKIYAGSVWLGWLAALLSIWPPTAALTTAAVVPPLLLLLLPPPLLLQTPSALWRTMQTALCCATSKRVRPSGLRLWPPYPSSTQVSVFPRVGGMARCWALLLVPASAGGVYEKLCCWDALGAGGGGAVCFCTAQQGHNAHTVIQLVTRGLCLWRTAAGLLGWT
jgi:hypothetical protein